MIKPTDIASSIGHSSVDGILVDKKSKPTNKKVSKAISMINSSSELTANESALSVIEECCAKAGVTLELVYGVLREGLQAGTPTEKVVQGEIVHGVEPDYNTRHKYMLTALELLKHLKDKNVVAVTGIFNDPTIADDARRILSLRGKIDG